MVHTLETRESSSEVKFLIDPSTAPAIRSWARTHLNADPHGLGPFRDEYDTVSLYFDTRCFDVFHRRGSFGRAKYRVRRYGNDDSVFLERKLRKPGFLVKRRTAAPLSTLSRLRDTQDGSSWAGDWFHRRLVIRRLRPVCQVAYHRTARSIETSTGLARLTLDCGLRAAPVNEPTFSPSDGTPFLQQHLILELKYRGHLPALFRRLVEEFALTSRTASKYRVAMAALGHVPASDEPPVLHDLEDVYA